MNIAFPALLILLLVLPGVIVRYAYLRGTFANSPFRFSSLTDEIAYGVLWAFLLHVVWGCVVSLLGGRIDLESALSLLLGSFDKDQSRFTPAVRSLTDHPIRIALYFGGLYLASFLAGMGAHILVRKERLDLQYRWLRFSNEWHYLLSGEVLRFADNPDQTEDTVLGVYLSAVLKQGDKTYLYRGIVGDYFFTKTGELDRIVLREVQRREMEQDRKSGDPRLDPAEDPRYYTIEGNGFVLKYAEIETLNLEYILIREEETPEPSPPPGSVEP